MSAGDGRWATVRAFVPALMLWPLWAYTIGTHDAWADVFEPYWPMTVAMVAGSFIAGSTPLGGGVVAYPVSQLVLVWPAAEARDASVLVQMVGMNAAAYLLFTSKREMLDPRLILCFTVVGAWGVLLGTIYSPSPGLANIVFACSVLLFAIAYFYLSELLPPTPTLTPALTPTPSLSPQLSPPQPSRTQSQSQRLKQKQPQPSPALPPVSVQLSSSFNSNSPPASTSGDLSDERESHTPYSISAASAVSAPTPLSLEQPMPNPKVPPLRLEAPMSNPKPPPRRQGRRSSAATAASAAASAFSEVRSPRLTFALMAGCAFLGGVLTASVGSGSDIVLYAFGTFGWNCLQPHLHISDAALTANSVVVMGALSAFTVLARALNYGFTDRVLLCWGADAFVVVVGAPVGSLILSPAASGALRKLFYVLAVVQFCSYALLEEAFHDATVAPYVGSRVWAYLGLALAFELMLLAMHKKWRRALSDALRYTFSFDDIYAYALSSRHSRKSGSYGSLYALAKSRMSSSQSLLHLV